MITNGRWPPRNGLALVFSGGGALGAYQVGVIDAFARGGIKPQLIVGTSVGAINGTYWAFNPGPDAGQELLDIWRTCGRRTLFSDGLSRVLWRFLSGRDHLYGIGGLRRLLLRRFDESLGLEDSTIPVAVVVTDALSGDRRVLRSGHALDAVLASCAIPGLLPSVRINGHPYCDGGVVSHCDVEAAVDAGMATVIAVDVGGEMPTLRGALGAIARATSFNLRRQSELAYQLAAREVELYVLQSNVAGAPKLGDFRYTNRLFEAGRDAGLRFLATLPDRYRARRPSVLEFPEHVADVDRCAVAP